MTTAGNIELIEVGRDRDECGSLGGWARRKNARSSAGPAVPP